MLELEAVILGGFQGFYYYFVSMVMVLILWLSIIYGSRILNIDINEKVFETVQRILMFLSVFGLIVGIILFKLFG